MAYERKVGKVLRTLWPMTRSAIWFAFEDANGPGCCQMDHLAVFPDQVLVIECKLSETDYAWLQIEALYAPVLGEYFQRPVTGIQATRHLRNETEIADVREALTRPGGRFLWHYLG